MFNYLKIGLLALLSMGSLLAMELPEPQPASKVYFSDLDNSADVLELSIQDALRAKTLADWISCCEGNNAFSLPSQEFNAVKIIKDFVTFNEDNLGALKKALNRKDNIRLCHIINAADALNAENLLDTATTLLAQRLNHYGMQEKCRKNGSYNLLLNSHTRDLVAQKMDQLDSVILETLLHVQTSTPCNILSGHLDRVTSVCTSPDGRYIVSGSGDATICVWDLKSGALISTLRGDTAKTVNCVCVSPNSKYIISGLNTAGVYDVWDIAKGSFCGHFRLIDQDHMEPVNSVCMSPDGNYIISGSSQGTILVYDIRCFSFKYDALKGHKGTVTSVCMSPDGKYIVSGSTDATIRVWDIETGKCIICTLPRNTMAITSVCVSADSKHVISGSDDGSICIWTINKGTLLRIFHYHESYSVKSVCMSLDGNYIISGSADGCVRIWDIKKDKCIGIFRNCANRMNSVCISVDSKYIIAGSDDKGVYKWEMVDPSLFEECIYEKTPEKITAMRYCYKQLCLPFIDYSDNKGLKAIIATFSNNMRNALGCGESFKSSEKPVISREK